MANHTIHCPQSASECVVFSKKRGIRDCEDCGHEFSPAKASSPLCIFLSHGHDRNEKLVLRICGDLKKRGHDVWIDKTEIKAGEGATHRLARHDRVLQSRTRVCPDR